MRSRSRFAALLLLLFTGVGLVSAQGPVRRSYLPVVVVSHPPRIFGVEATLPAMRDARVVAQAKALGASWTRLNGVLWSRVEPTRGATYDWSQLAGFEQSLAQARAAGMTPVVIVRGTPLWAASTAGSACSAIADAYIADFGRFLSALVARYRGQVSYWEITNEPDVDPSLVSSSVPYGCWGNIKDTYYGGERYGRMLRAVAPSIRAANPHARIILGGLLLGEPITNDRKLGHPERFLEGVLRSGAADSFDVVAYHSYPLYLKPNYDHDLLVGASWPARGGWTLGKTSFVREVMARYGVSKPLWLNEVGLRCEPIYYAQCSSPPPAFFEAQADYLVRMMARAAAAGVEQVSWFTLDGPGWQGNGLLDATQQPRPAFMAYDRMIAAVGRYTQVRAISDYGPSVEAYRFVGSGSSVDVLWSRSANVVTVQVPIGAYRSAVVRDGGLPPIARSGSSILVGVGFPAVFIERLP